MNFKALFESQTVAVIGVSLTDNLNSNAMRDHRCANLIKERSSPLIRGNEIFQLLNNTFITPFDREDIQLLANRMDDVMDMVEKASVALRSMTCPVRRLCLS